MDRLAGERGETLMEILVTILVISIGLVAIVGMLGGSILASDAHRSMANAEVITRDFGEAIKKRAAQVATYTSCPQKADLTPSFTVADWSTTITGSVEYWIPNPADYPNGAWTTNRSQCTAYFAACTPPADVGLLTCDPGLQRVTISVKGPTSRTDYGNQSAIARILTRRGHGELAP